MVTQLARKINPRSLDSPRRSPDYLTAADLRPYGLAPADVRRRYPWAVEYVALDGRPCWLAADLATLLGQGGGAQ
jgi:hypothetical protein